MQVLRRLVWWKIVFWSLVGAGAGLAVSTFWPEVNVPAGAMRVDPERLAVVLTPGSTGNEAATHVVLYPAHDQVRLVTFGWRDNGKTQSAYAFANRPFLRAQELENVITVGRRVTLQMLRAIGAARPPSFSYGTTLRIPADRALAEVSARPGKRWDDVAEFFDHIRAVRPEFSYQTAWWADERWRRDAPVAAGVVLVGLLGALLTMRSAADLAAADLLRQTRTTESTLAPQPSAAVDLREVEALDQLLEAKLAAGLPDEPEPAHDPSMPPAAAAVVAELKGERLVAAAEQAKQNKDYAGEFYPTVRGPERKGFSLVELLVAIGVIGVLMAILLPAVIGARRSADTIACGSNLRGIGQGMTLYLAQFHNTFPAAYLYIGQHMEAGAATGTSPSDGYVHWSSYLYGNGSVNQNAFKCPAMRQGGLPPTNTPPDNRDPGQVCPSSTVVDQQAPRLAYTVNEVLCPRNKFNTPDFGGHRVYRFVKSTEVTDSAGTILGMEMIDNAIAVSYDVTGTNWVMSHRPIAGFVGLNGELDMYTIPVGTKFRPATAADLDADPNTAAATTAHTRLDLVGRNHGKKAGYPDRRVSNFLYVDGHVETKSIYDTMEPFQWGEKFYSMTPNDDQVNP